MWRPVRYMAILLLLAVLFGALTGCAGPPEAGEGVEEGSQVDGGADEKTGEAGLETLSFVLDVEANREMEAQAIVAQLEELGIDAKVRVWEWSVLKEQIKAGERQAYATDWGSAFFDPFDLAVPKLRTKDRGNYSFYSNSDVDELLDRAISAVDPGERRLAYHAAQEKIYEDAPWVFGYIIQNIEAASASVRGWKPSMDTRINLHDVSVEGGNVIVVGLRTNAIKTLDPANYRDRETETVIRNLFDGLVTRTPDGRVVPEIAKGWDVSDDGLTYTFHLRDDVLFHDGTKLTADDVVFTFQRVLGLGPFDSPSPRQGLIQPKGAEVTVEKLDDHTVAFEFSQPFPVFLQGLVHQQIVPKHYVAEVGDEEFARHPVGTGPFKLVEARLDDQVVMERWDRYYGGSPELPPVGPAKLDKAIFRMMPEPSTRVAALKAGEVHIIQQVLPDLVSELESDPKVVVKFAEGTRCFAIELNNSKPPFDDARVRRALNYAVDWKPILEEIYGGYATRLSTAFLPSGFGYHEGLEPYPHDPEKAKELLEEAGYRTE